MVKISNPPTYQEKLWNFLASIFFVVCIIILGYFLEKEHINIEDIKLLDLFLIMVSTYRLTRIMVFDKIFKIFRDFIKSRSRLYLFNVLREIITCPWCAGVWAALMIVAMYYFMPYGILVIYLLAISGVASFFVVFVNNIGLSTEKRQHKVAELQRSSDYTKLQN